MFLNINLTVENVKHNIVKDIKKSKGSVKDTITNNALNKLPVNCIIDLINYNTIILIGK